MHVGVIHTIKDRARWDEVTGALDPAATPPGVSLLATVTATDVSRAICIWDGPSVEHMQAMLDGMLGPAAVNDCFAADAARSYGVAQPAQPAQPEGAQA
ncbi:hypothetical protein ACVGOW_05120 [Pseudonocardia saturnea]